MSQQTVQQKGSTQSKSPLRYQQDIDIDAYLQVQEDDEYQYKLEHQTNQDNENSRMLRPRLLNSHNSKSSSQLTQFSVKPSMVSSINSDAIHFAIHKGNENINQASIVQQKRQQQKLQENGITTPQSEYQNSSSLGHSRQQSISQLDNKIQPSDNNHVRVASISLEDDYYVNQGSYIQEQEGESQTISSYEQNSNFGKNKNSKKMVHNKHKVSQSIIHNPMDISRSSASNMMSLVYNNVQQPYQDTVNSSIVSVGNIRSKRNMHNKTKSLSNLSSFVGNKNNNVTSSHGDFESMLQFIKGQAQDAKNKREDQYYQKQMSNLNNNTSFSSSTKAAFTQQKSRQKNQHLLNTSTAAESSVSLLKSSRKDTTLQDSASKRLTFNQTTSSHTVFNITSFIKTVELSQVINQNDISQQQTDDQYHQNLNSLIQKTIIDQMQAFIKMKKDLLTKIKEQNLAKSSLAMDITSLKQQQDVLKQEVNNNLKKQEQMIQTQNDLEITLHKIKEKQFEKAGEYYNGNCNLEQMLEHEKQTYSDQQLTAQASRDQEKSHLGLQEQVIEDIENKIKEADETHSNLKKKEKELMQREEKTLMSLKQNGGHVNKIITIDHIDNMMHQQKKSNVSRKTSKSKERLTTYKKL